MPYSTVMDLTFDPADHGASEAAVIEVIKEWWSIRNEDANTIAHPEFVSDGADSYMLIDIAARDATIPAVTRAFATQAAMNADLAYAAGTVVNCYDPDPTKRGRYTKSGASGSGSWGLTSATITSKMWPDPNHVQRLLELVLCSWIGTSPVPFGSSGSLLGWTSPPGNDWTNARVTFDMACEDLYLGPWAKLCQHIQGEIDSLTDVIPQEHGSGNHAFPNFILTRQLISDQLGFAQPGSWGRPNMVPYVKNSGRKNVVLDYTPSDHDWASLGSVMREYANSPFHYVVVPIAHLLSNLVGNSYMMVVHDRPQADAAYWSAMSTGIDEADRIAGKLEIYGIKVESWSEV